MGFARPIPLVFIIDEVAAVIRSITTIRLLLCVISDRPPAPPAACLPQALQCPSCCGLGSRLQPCPPSSRANRRRLGPAKAPAWSTSFSWATVKCCCCTVRHLHFFSSARRPVFFIFSLSSHKSLHVSRHKSAASGTREWWTCRCTSYFARHDRHESSPVGGDQTRFLWQCCDCLGPSAALM